LAAAAAGWSALAAWLLLMPVFLPQDQELVPVPAVLAACCCCCPACILGSVLLLALLLALVPAAGLCCWQHKAYAFLAMDPHAQPVLVCLVCQLLCAAC
jgi:hypothetical protein